MRGKIQESGLRGKGRMSVTEGYLVSGMWERLTAARLLIAVAIQRAGSQIVGDQFAETAQTHLAGGEPKVVVGIVLLPPNLVLALFLAHLTDSHLPA